MKISPVVESFLSKVFDEEQMKTLFEVVSNFKQSNEDETLEKYLIACANENPSAVAAVLNAYNSEADDLTMENFQAASSPLKRLPRLVEYLPKLTSLNLNRNPKIEVETLLQWADNLPKSAVIKVGKGCFLAGGAAVSDPITVEIFFKSREPDLQVSFIGHEDVKWGATKEEKDVYLETLNRSLADVSTLNTLVYIEANNDETASLENVKRLKQQVVSCTSAAERSNISNNSPTAIASGSDELPGVACSALHLN